MFYAWSRCWRRPNWICHGPTGTSTTYRARLIANSTGHDKAAFVTFQQFYSYEDFVEELRTETGDVGNAHQQVNPGVFKRLCLRTRQDMATDDGVGRLAVSAGFRY